MIRKMPYRLIPFVTQYCYHLFNRGVEKRTIFSNNQDYQRFLRTLYYYQFNGPKPRFSTYKKFKKQNFDQNPKIIDVLCYCLMPNHFHILVRQVRDGGVQEFMGKVINSYTKYYNVKHNRVGHLFQGAFKAVFIETDEQLLHVSRYIHLNPHVSNLTNDLEQYYYSSYPSFIGLSEDSLTIKEPILGLFKDVEKYKEFINDNEDYARELEQLKHLLIDPED